MVHHTGVFRFDRRTIRRAFRGRAMKRLLQPGDAVRLHPDAGEPNKDRYGRLLRYVYKTRSGTDDIGRELVREGWAEVYLKYPTSRTPAYLKVQAVAKRHHRGIWGLCR